jgi:hypothetical protein
MILYQLGYSSPGGFTLAQETTDPEKVNEWLRFTAPEGRDGSVQSVGSF